MSECSYYHCQHCTEEIAYEIQCPCCGLGESLDTYDEGFENGKKFWIKQMERTINNQNPDGRINFGLWADNATHDYFSSSNEHNKTELYLIIKRELIRAFELGMDTTVTP